MEWISVKTRLPEIAEILILQIKHKDIRVCAGFRANGGWYVFQIREQSKTYIRNENRLVEITHWMSLPKKVEDFHLSNVSDSSSSSSDYSEQVMKGLTGILAANLTDEQKKNFR